MPATRSVPAAKALEQPVVHKVVFGGGGAESVPGLLERMRQESAKPVPRADKAPAAETGGGAAFASATTPAPAPVAQQSMGFTQLLRTLGNELPATAPAAKPTPVAEPRPTAQDAGFTALLRTLGSAETAAAPAEAPTRAAQSPACPIPEEPRATPAAGGFTALLHTIPPEDAARSGAVVLDSPPAASQPGTFTQLFSALEGEGATPSAPPPAVPAAADRSSPGPGSFTRMLAIERQSSPIAPALSEERQPVAERLDYGITPGTVNAPGPVGATRDPFSSPSPLPQSAPPAAGVGITRLIRMLDVPGAAPPRAEAAPSDVLRGSEPGVWTQTFAALSTPDQPPAPTAKPTEWTPAPASVAPAPPDNVPAAPAHAAGPSEFTRILDASRMRELAMRGGQVPGATNSTSSPIPPASAPAQSPPMPTYGAPPPIPPTQGFGAAPHPGSFPPQPSYPMSYAPHPSSLPAAAGGAPPGMYASHLPPASPPMPAAPQAPSVKPPQMQVSKFQQMVPLLLVLVGVLLLVVLVLLIFLLLKH